MFTAGDMGPEVLALLAGAGVAAGFINTVAGGGSLLTLPALMLAGLPADVANGTNRVGILLQSGAAALAFDRDKQLVARGSTLWAFVWPTLLGAFLGATAASSIPRASLRPILLTTLVLMAVLIAAKPKLLAPGPSEAALHPADVPAARWWLLLTGAYGGFLQAGIGFMLLAVLSGVLRHRLAHANAIKVVIVAALTVVALAIFVIRGQVVWLPGLVCGAGAIGGSLLGVRFAQKTSGKVLRLVVLVMVVAAATKLAFF